MSNPKTSTCCTCGYSWTTGTDGSHSCTEHIKDYVHRLVINCAAKHWSAESPNFQPLDDLPGLLSQLDNMLAGMCNAKALDLWILRAGDCAKETNDVRKQLTLEQSRGDKLCADLSDAKDDLVDWTQRADAETALHENTLRELAAAKQREADLAGALRRILEYPVHSEPVGGAMAMQDIAHEALNPK